MGLLKELLSGTAETKTKKPRGVLIPVLNDALVEFRQAKYKPRYPFWVRDVREKPRVDGRFHPSSTAGDFCPREWVIGQHRLGPVNEEERPPSLRGLRIFGIGNATHDLLQWWLAETGLLYGMWRCDREPEKHVQWGTSLISCRCGGRMVFAEVPIDHTDTGILGHCDGEIAFAAGRWAAELKSCNAREYDRAGKEPLHDHKEQAWQYLWLRAQSHSAQQIHLGETTVPPGPMLGAVILYWNKDSQEMREHIYPWPEYRTRINNMMKEKVSRFRAAQAFRPGKLHTLPDRICDSKKEGEMRGCPVSETCFHKLPPIVHRRARG